MTERIQFWAAVDIARENNKQLYETTRAIEKLEIESDGVVGGRRVYGPEKRKMIEAVLNEVDNVN